MKNFDFVMNGEDNLEDNQIVFDSRFALDSENMYEISEICSIDITYSNGSYDESSLLVRKGSLSSWEELFPLVTAVETSFKEEQDAAAVAEAKEYVASLELPKPEPAPIRLVRYPTRWERFKSSLNETYTTTWGIYAFMVIDSFLCGLLAGKWFL